MTFTILARLPRAVCAAVLAFTSELVPARELPLHDFDDEPIAFGSYLESAGASLSPEYTDLFNDRLGRSNNPSAAAVPPAAACCSEGGVTPGVVPPSEPPTHDPVRAANDRIAAAIQWAKDHLYEHTTAYYDDTDRNK